MRYKHLFLPNFCGKVIEKNQYFSRNVKAQKNCLPPFSGKNTLLNKLYLKSTFKESFFFYLE